MDNHRQQELLLRIEDLKKYYELKSEKLFGAKKYVQALDGVSLDLYRGETIGLVGESGCGKSTLAQTLVRLVEPTSGKALFNGKDIFTLKKEEMRQLRRKVQIIFQDPYDSLNPRMTVRQIVSEAWKVFPDLVPKSKWDQQVCELLTRVGMNPQDAERFPHQFSGGQRQRIGIARALSLNPELIVCDEPVSALDVSVQAQVVNLLDEIQESFGLSYIFIAHDLSVVRHISDRVFVMYLGKIAESGPVDIVYELPAHPYTQALLSSVPLPDKKARARIIKLDGDVPSPINPPEGCRFNTRCWKAQQQCREEAPSLDDLGDGRSCACFYPEVKRIITA